MTQVPYSRQAVCHHEHTFVCGCAGCKGDECWGQAHTEDNHYWLVGLNRYQRDALLSALKDNPSLNTGDWWLEVIHKLRSRDRG